MQNKDWKQVKELLNQSLEFEPAFRQEFLNKTASSQTIINEVNALLAFESEAEDLMSLSALEFSKDFFADDFNALIGQQIGVYQIIKELAFGGMGAVYLAKRIDGKFEQKVAIKMLKREFNFEKVRLNFKREKEILSKLLHPYIARLLDAGTTDDGVPFLVMEYIEGIAVDEFCERENLDLNSRLKIFNKICEAVSFAHQNLIVHRDLKPTNILITKNGTPKLLDFGISKLLDENAQTSVTIAGAMTLEYASPEQIKGEAITTASDIYSLGVVLNKMLTSSLPYKLTGKTKNEIFKTISEIEPTTASSIIKTANENNENSVITSPQLKGDLDNIILKTLSKEPSRRYQTVEQFSTDIWRFIDGLPVLARPATFSYQASKYFQRNKIKVVAAALILLSLISGIAIALWQAKTANEQANIALEAQKQAEMNSLHAKEEAEKSEKVSQFMFKIFSYANPAWYAEGYKSRGQARVIDVLDNLSDKIETEFPNQADTQAELHHQFADVYGRIWQSNTEPARRLEMKEKSHFHICRALQLRRQYYGEWHELVAKDLYHGLGCIGKTPSDYAASLNKAIIMMRETNPKNINLPYMLTDYAAYLTDPLREEIHNIYLRAVTPPINENKYEIAERYLREALPLYKLHYRKDELPILVTECQLAYVLAIQDKWTDFDEYYTACKQGKTQLVQMSKSTNSSNPLLLDYLEKLLVEKNKERIK